jgi:hypothetical protein
MESMLTFVTKFTNVVKDHINETKECIGKEVIDSTATKSGICVDKIKIAYGAKFSLLGHNYNDADKKRIEVFSEDVLVSQGPDGYEFIPMSDIEALGGSVILVRTSLNKRELNGQMTGRREEVFRKFFTTKESIKKLLPKVETGARRAVKKKSPLHIFH